MNAELVSKMSLSSDNHRHALLLLAVWLACPTIGSSDIGCIAASLKLLLNKFAIIHQPVLQVVGAILSR